MRPADHANQSRAGRESGFTLIELMVVVAVIGLMAVFSIPAIRQATHREALSQAIVDVTEACGRARAKAIMQGSPVEVRIKMEDRSISVADAPAAASPAADGDFKPAPGAKSDNVAGFTAKISDDLVIRMLDVNLVEYKDSPEAHVRFFPNGTSDEFTLILQANGGETKMISLEVVTALVNVGPVR